MQKIKCYFLTIRNKDVIKHILIYKLPVDTFDLHQLQLQTNSFFKQHLKGPKENSYVEIENLYPFERDIYFEMLLDHVQKVNEQQNG